MIGQTFLVLRLLQYVNVLLLSGCEDSFNQYNKKSWQKSLPSTFNCCSSNQNDTFYNEINKKAELLITNCYIEYYCCLCYNV